MLPKKEKEKWKRTRIQLRLRLYQLNSLKIQFKFTLSNTKWINQFDPLTHSFISLLFSLIFRFHFQTLLTTFQLNRSALSFAFCSFSIHSFFPSFSILTYPNLVKFWLLQRFLFHLFVTFFFTISLMVRIFFSILYLNSHSSTLSLAHQANCVLIWIWIPSFFHAKQFVP